MIALRQNLLFFNRNHYRIRSVASFAHSTVFEKRLNIRLPKQSPENITSCGKCVQFSPLAIQKVQFLSEVSTLSQLDYENFCAETLDELCDYFEELVESTNDLAAADVVNKDGVLTVSLGSKYGTYVINKQSPNKQIWLSSPISGPKRFEFVYAKNGNKNGYYAQ